MDETNNSVENPAPEAEPITKEPSQDPIDVEIEKEKEKAKTFTEAEKAAFNLKKNAERAKELGVDPADVLGISAQVQANDEEVPEWFKRKEAEAASKTALQLAESIEDPRERELVKMKLETVVTSGSPEERLRVARGYVNSVRNGQIAEEMGRKQTPGAYSSGAGAPANQAAPESELTPAEMLFTRPPISMTKEQIIAARPKD